MIDRLSRIFCYYYCLLLIFTLIMISDFLISLYYKTVIVKMKDGRLLRGTFVSCDYLGNILLTAAKESKIDINDDIDDKLDSLEWREMKSVCIPHIDFSMIYCVEEEEFL
eukprot:TRINITY_DN988_c0_g1_i1.p1 TRINITY_DN988_c0_g1~~TRINITY_DN988_c0_g1_i1.p1  ORF type:complete len:110 (+),score=25.02 TRINITY_DN988_c0_g1_i1:77-406(+)